MSRVGTTGLRGRLALDTAGLTGYSHDPTNDPEVAMPPRRNKLSLSLPLPLKTAAGCCH